MRPLALDNLPWRLALSLSNRANWTFGQVISAPLSGGGGRVDPEDFDSAREVLLGSFGLILGWSKDTKIARRSYNARSETASVKPSFRNAWKYGQHCIISAAAIYEPDWRSG